MIATVQFTFWAVAASTCRKTTEALDSKKIKIARRDIETDVMAFSNPSKLFYPWEPWKKNDTEFTKDPTFYCIPVD